MKELTVRVAIVDDHPVVVNGLIASLRTFRRLEVVDVAQTASAAAALLAREDVDVILLDVRLGTESGLQVLADRAEPVKPYVLVLSSFNARQYVAAATRWGASGFLLKTCPLPQLVRAIRIVAAGGTVFTQSQLDTALVTFSPRERDVIALTMRGMTNKEIAEALRTSKKAVEQHLSEIFEREHIDGGRVELALRAAEEGWLEISAPAPRRSRLRERARPGM